MNGGWITLIIIAIIISLILLFKLYLVLTVDWDKSATCLNGKTVLVTGANTGLGFYTAQDFAKRGAKVILACRDPIRAEEAKSKLIQATGNRNIIVRIVDLASLASVRKFAVEIKTTEERLDILVNNAGAVGLEQCLTPDGLNLLMQINYFGPFLLTILLLDLIKRSAPSRIVNVSSSAIFLAKLNLVDLNAAPRSIVPTHHIMYANSKLCNIIFTNELARRLRGTGVDINCVDPGVVKTELMRYLTGIAEALYSVISKLLKTAEEGAQTYIYVAVSKDIDGVTGEYFADCKRDSMPRAARGGDLANKLWEKSEVFVKLTPEEKQLI